MKRFTKQLTIGLAVLGLIAPMAGNALNNDVHASRYSYRRYVRKHRRHAVKLPHRLRRTWYGSYASKMAQVNKIKLSGRPYVNNAPIRVPIRKIVRHGSHYYLYTESGNLSVWYSRGHLRCHLLLPHGETFNLYK